MDIANLFRKEKTKLSSTIKNDFNMIDKPMMTCIVRAVSKAVSFDMRSYLNECNTDTHNAFILVRSDKLNTNLRTMVVAENNDLVLKHFKRFLWVGSLLIDRKHKITINVSSKGTIERLKSTKRRNSPHYLKSMCHVLNGDLNSPTKQMAFEGFDAQEDFSEEDYATDFESIVDLLIGPDDGYRHYVVAYEAEQFEIKSISLLLLDKDLNVVTETSLLDLLQPDFGELTVPFVAKEAEQKKQDSHSLIKVKPSTKSKRAKEPEKRPTISAKEEEGTKHA